MRRFNLVLMLMLTSFMTPDAVSETDRNSPQERRFVFPPITVLRPLVSDSSMEIEAAEVTFRLKMDRAGSILKLELADCTSEDTSFVATARQAVMATRFSPMQMMFPAKDPWLYHTVIFRPLRTHDSAAVAGAPDDTAFVPVDVQPEMIHEEAPEYPREAEAAGVTGTVWVKALVNKRGLVDEAKIVRSSGSEALDNSAVNSAYCNKFNPALRDGKPVAFWVTYRIAFKLSK